MRPLLKVSKIFSFIASPILILIGIINYISVTSSFDLSNSAQISGGMIYLLLSVGSAIAIFVSGFFIKPEHKWLNRMISPTPMSQTISLEYFITIFLF